MLEVYLREFVDFNTASTREYYLYFSGQKARYEIARIYDRYSDLFTIDAIQRLKRERDEIDPYFESNRTALDRLVTFASENYLDENVKHLTEEITNAENSASVEWQGKSVPFAQLHGLLANEADAARRRALYGKQLNVIAATNDLRGERVERLHELAVKLGYDNYVKMYESLHKIDYRALDANMQRFLADTDKVYTVNLERAVLRTLHMPLAQAERADTYYFARLTDFDALFPPESLISAYRETMENLGIHVDRQHNIGLDTAARARKSARAFCAPIVIPSEIKLVLKPVGGLQDYEVFFHEAGHAQHFAYTAADLRPEFKYTGDYALTESYAFLFNYLVGEPLWLEQMLNRRDLDELVEAITLAKLYTIRRYAGKLHYELQLHASATPGKSGASYRENLTEATKFQFDDSEYLHDLDDGFYAANYLRAWIFEVMLRDYLKTRYGVKWWRSQRAGNFLKELWHTGNRYTTEELAAQIGLGPLIIEPLEVEFLAGLKT